MSNDIKFDGWSIKGPAGEFIEAVIFDSPATAKQRLVDQDPDELGNKDDDDYYIRDPFETWDRYKEHGYRCVRVKLAEVQPNSER